MYTTFFGLNEKPFAITPDPRYLFMSARHGEGLAHLVYGVTEGGGFIQLTGEVGTGKTTLVRTLLGKLPDEVDIALILNPQVTVLEFLQVICQELAVSPPADGTSAMALVDALNRYLLDAHSRGRRTILMVDEAQNLSDEVLEQLRLLTNLETAKQKLLQIILIGQPELREVLAKNSLRQLAQRVTGRYHLEPLSRNEAMRYIDHRLKVAGGVGEIFDDRAKREVHRLSRGIPRVMNVICDRALLGAYGQETRKVSGKLVKRAALEVSGQASASHALKWVAAVLAVTALGLIGSSILKPVVDEEVVPESSTSEQPAATTPAPAIVAEDTAGAERPDGRPEFGFERQLVAGDLGVTRQASLAQMLLLWDIESVEGVAYDCTTLESYGLSCLQQRGSWSLLRQLDRPAIVTLVDSGGNSYQSVVTALSDSEVEFMVNGIRKSYLLADVSKFWFGRYLIVWRPPNGAAGAIAPGMRNVNVLWLRESLATLGHEAIRIDDDQQYFDTELEAKLREFQRRHRLQIDGIAGQRTQILINSLLALDGTPHLSHDG
ncbi:MAG: AAA family ATPase [Gammaproteobacteria bacterium]|nr:AAA family ATPase [Gammaproteobacteria bacterium]